MAFLLDEEEEMKGAPAAPINPLVAQDLAKKYPEALSYDQYQSKFGNNAFEKAQSEAADRKSGLGWAQFAAGIGDAFQGKSPSQSAATFDQIRKNIDGDTVGAFEKKRSAALQDITAKKSFEGSDPNSQKSIAARKAIEANFPAVAKQYGDTWANVAADDMDNLFKPLQLKENIEARKQTAAILAGDKERARQEKTDEKEIKLNTPYGLANTEDDAKQLKEAHESKKNFDGKLQDMIALREKHKGGDVFNRDDVARGKQLSKDLLLEYKNMQRLGVLSKADEDIINAIIPADPLEFNSPMAAIQGQDPTLHKMKSFKADSDNDFQTRVSTRTRQGLANTKSKHEEAVQWALNNPSDPRAAKILQKNGVKVGGK